MGDHQDCRPLGNVHSPTFLADVAYYELQECHLHLFEGSWIQETPNVILGSSSMMMETMSNEGVPER